MRVKKVLIDEAKVDDEYIKNYSNIDRESFDKVVLADPFTRVVNQEIQTIGPNAKQLLLPKYETEKDFILNHLEEIKTALQKYMDNRRSYPQELRNISNFNSVEEFLKFIENPEDVKIEVIKKEEQAKNPLDEIYDKYYSDIDKDVFTKIIKLDSETTDSKIGEVAKNLLLPKYKTGEKYFLEKETDIKDAIDIFYEDKVKYSSDKQNLQNYDSVEEFVKFITEGPDSNLVQSLKNNPAIQDKFKVIASTRDYDIIQPLSSAANKAIGGGWDTSDGMHWCTTMDNDRGGYWKRYTANGSTIYCIMHKVENRGKSNAVRNWQLQLSQDNEVLEFLDGADLHTYDSNPKKDFSIFLGTHPEILLKLKDVAPFKDVPEVIEQVANLKYKHEPLVINSNKDLLSLFNLKSSGYQSLTQIVKEVIINNISKIPARLFYNFKALQKLNIGPSIKIIGNQCFKDCNELREVILSEGLEIIEAEVFMGCRNLKKLRLPNSVREIRERAFDDTSCRIGVQISRAESDSILKVPKSEEKWYIKHLDPKKS